jgi:release factor glutamine methyltransferase
MHISEARVDFGELEKRHFPTIEKNISENGIDATRTRVLKTDIWSGIKDRYDFVLANPPYLSNRRVGRIEESVLEYEPPEALFADDDGFGFIAATIAGLPEHLSPGGSAWIEHEPEHAKRVAEESAMAGFNAETLPDQYGTMRFSHLWAVAR